MSGSVGDNTARASGVVASAGGGGKVLQVVQTQLISCTTFNTGDAGTFTDISGLSCAITPIKEGSKILCTTNIGIGNNAGTIGFFLLTADIAGAGYVSLIYGDADGLKTRSWGGGNNCYSKRDITVMSGSYLWTPSYTLTDVLTVQPQVSGGGGTGSRINGSSDNNNGSYNARGTSDITLWEIN